MVCAWVYFVCRRVASAWEKNVSRARLNYTVSRDGKGGYGVVFEGCRGGRKGGGGEGHEVLIDKVFGVFLGCCGDIAFYCGGRTLLDDLICSLELF